MTSTADAVPYRRSNEPSANDGSYRPDPARLIKRIGLVEDDDQVRNGVSRALANSGTLQLWFDTNNVHGAIDWMRTCPAADWPDIWLVNLSLPDGSGLAVVQEAKGLHPNTEVIVLSGTSDERAVLDSVVAGASGYLLKGEEGERLVEHIHAVMNGGAPLSPLIARRLVDQVRVLSAHVARRQTPQVHLDEMPLTRREVMTLRWVARGCSYAEVAEKLSVKTNTVRYYVKNIYRKMKVGSKTEALYEARRRGWILDT